MTEKMKKLAAYLHKHNLHDWATTVTHFDDALEAVTIERDALLIRVKEAEAANELDRSRVAVALSQLHAAIRARDWVLEGRGPYEWDDDDYRAEFSLWVDDVASAADLFAKIAIDWHGCPMDHTAIRHARAMLHKTPEKP